MNKEVRFVLTSTDSIPEELKGSGSLIVMSDPDKTILASEVGKVHDKYLYYEDEIIAGGLGFNTVEDLLAATYAGLSYNDVYSKLLSLYERDDVYLLMAYDYADSHGGGVGESYWGGISGNIVKQQDLYSYITYFLDAYTYFSDKIMYIEDETTALTYDINLVQDRITDLESYAYTSVGYVENLINSIDKYYPLSDEDVDEAINRINE